MIKRKAFAKLNLALDITGRRADGYHLLDTIFQEISLHDDIALEPAETVDIQCPGISPEDNIAGTAARAFFQRTGIRGGVRIVIDKHIPAGAGLGGGSSDAACVLRALNEMYAYPLQHSDLLMEAAKLGADVPACLEGGTQRARGIGDILTPVRSRCNLRYLLVKPEQGIETARAYKLCDKLPGIRVDIGRAADALENGCDTDFFKAAGNSLLPAALELVPEIAEAGQECLDNGAFMWMLTGSGSCIFSVFADNATREQARAALSRRYPFVKAAEAHTNKDT